MWNEIKTTDDITDLMTQFGSFHDSCIKEIRYISGAFVDEDLGMVPMNLMRNVDVVFQRQYRNPMAIVMRFTGVSMLHLPPDDENSTCDIYGATLFIKDGCIYWADCDGVEEMKEYVGTWICADSVQWRSIDECMGESIVFQANFDID